MTDKATLRSALKHLRSVTEPAELMQVRAAVRNHVLAWVDANLSSGATVAGYEPLPDEPASLELLDDLRERDITVIVPITLPDQDLDWRRYRDDSATPLGLSAIGSADLVLVPAFAVDDHGNRLGRGGGSYDRALARIAPSTVTVALLCPGEFVHAVPTDKWDVPVSALVTPEGWHTFR